MHLSLSSAAITPNTGAVAVQPPPSVMAVPAPAACFSSQLYHLLATQTDTHKHVPP